MSESAPPHSKFVATPLLKTDTSIKAASLLTLSEVRQQTPGSSCFVGGQFTFSVSLNKKLIVPLHHITKCGVIQGQLMTSADIRVLRLATCCEIK